MILLVVLRQHQPIEVLFAELAARLEEPFLQAVVVAAPQTRVMHAEHILPARELLKRTGHEGLDGRFLHGWLVTTRPVDGMLHDLVLRHESAGFLDRFEHHLVPLVELTRRTHLFRWTSRAALRLLQDNFAFPWSAGPALHGPIREHDHIGFRGNFWERQLGEPQVPQTGTYDTELEIQPAPFGTILRQQYVYVFLVQSLLRHGKGFFGLGRP